jgi:signal transduction histidine kinase
MVRSTSGIHLATNILEGCRSAGVPLLKIQQIAEFKAVRSSAADALDRLGPHAAAIFRAWRRRLSPLELSSEEAAVLATVDLESMAAKLRRISYQSLSRWGIRLGEEMQQRGIKIDRLLGPMNQLLEICLGRLAGQRDSPQAALALPRLHSLAVDLVVHGYIQHCDTSIRALTSNLRDAKRHLHKASAYVTEVYERDRRRLSHDLHDELGPDLMLLKVYLELLVLDTEKPGFGALKPKAEEGLALISHTIQSLRRITLDLGPAVLDELGLVGALNVCARQLSSATGIQVTVTSENMAEQLPLTHEVALYRILQGALSNVIKHSKAGNVSVSVRTTKDSRLMMVIEDDGAGFDSAAILARRSFGLSSMRERAEVLGGTFRIKSARTGMLSRKHGTRIEVDLPLSLDERR